MSCRPALLTNRLTHRWAPTSDVNHLESAPTPGEWGRCFACRRSLTHVTLSTEEELDVEVRLNRDRDRPQLLTDIVPAGSRVAGWMRRRD